MAKVILGKILMTFRDEINWTATPVTPFTMLDVVEYQDSTFLCIVDPTDNQPPTDETYWRVLCKGAYKNWLDAGNTGTPEEFRASLKGSPGDTLPVQFNFTDTWMQWRNVGDTEWTNGVLLSALGVMPSIVNGYWYINGQATGVRALAQDGLPGTSLTWNSLTEAQKTEIKEDIAGGVYEPLVTITKAERKFGTIELFGTTYDVFRILAEIEDLPLTVDSEEIYVLSEAPLGFNLYLNVHSFVVAKSTSSAITSEFYTPYYQISKLFVDSDLSTKVTVKCIKDIPEGVDVKASIQADYIKDVGDLLEFTVTVPAGINPANVEFMFAPVKYNKKMIFSIGIDDGDAAWNNHFAVINKRWVDNEKMSFFYPSDSRYFTYHPEEPFEFPDHSGTFWQRTNGLIPPKFIEFSEVAGNPNSPKRRYACSQFAWWDAMGPERDTKHNWLWTKTSAIEMREMQDFGWSVGFHDLAYDVSEYCTFANTTQPQFDEFVRVTGELFRMLLDRFPKTAGIASGNDVYNRFAFCKYIGLFYAGENSGLNPVPYKPFAANQSMWREDPPVQHKYFWGSGTEIQDMPAKIATEMAKSPVNREWMLHGLHLANRDSGYYEFFQQIESSYGVSGDDSLWFPCFDEVYEYWFFKKYASVVKIVDGQNIRFKIHIPFADNFWFKSISCMLSGITSLSNISVTSSDNCKGMSYGLTHDEVADETKLLVNLDFNTDLITKVEKYLTVFEATPLKEFAFDNAQYFVQLLKTGVREPYQARIDALSAAPTLSSASINAGAANATNRNVTITVVATNNPGEILLSEDSNFSGASWVPYVASNPFTLSAGFGNKTIYVQLRNSFGDSSVVSDSIQYVDTPLVLNSASINAGAATTNNVAVNVGFNYTGTPTHYMLSESASFVGAEWIAFAENPAFNLSSGFGVKTVYVKLKNVAGETSAVSDAIELVDANALYLNSISLDAGASETGSGTVAVTLNVTGTPTQYRIGETADLSALSWTNIPAGAINFMLSAGYGNKTVYVQIRNATNVSAVQNDSITVVQPVTLESIVINSGDASTSDRTVSIALVTITGTPTHYKVGETSDLAGASWIAYTGTPISYQITSATGAKTVYVQIKNSVSQSAIRSDGITLSAAAVKAVISFEYGYGNGQIVGVTDGAHYGSPAGYSSTHGWINNTGIGTGTGGNFSHKVLRNLAGQEITGWKYIHDVAFYPAVSGKAPSGENAGVTAHPELTGNAGPYEDTFLYSGICTSMMTTASNRSRIVLSLPNCSYTLKIIMSSPNNSFSTEAKRLGSKYEVEVASGTGSGEVTAAESGFNVQNNAQFNATLAFTVTDATEGNVTLWFWNQTIGGEGYIPIINLIEITGS